MMSMFATLALAGKAENMIPDSVLLEGTAPSIVNADYDVLTCGISISTWAEFVAPSPKPKNKSSKAQAETTLTFDPLGMLPTSSRHQDFTPVSSRQRHGHSLILAVGIHHMSGSDSESDASSSDDELPCSAMQAKDLKNGSANDQSQHSTTDTLPDQYRTATLESLTSYCEHPDAGISGQDFPTKESLCEFDRSVSGFADDELEDEDDED